MSYGYDLFEFQGEPEIEAYKCLILDSVHFAPASTPLFYQSLGQAFLPCSFHYGHEYVMIPGAKGLVNRTWKGLIYVTAEMTTEEERREREPIFRERMAKWIGDPFAAWNELKAELVSLYDRYAPLNVEQMGPARLASHLWDVWRLYGRQWELHFAAWMVYAGALGVFRDMAAELLGLQYTDSLWAKLLSGYDNALFQVNKALADLASKAMELKLEDQFKLPDEQVLPAIEQSAAGGEWLKGFNDFLAAHGWRMQRMMEFNTPCWSEKPSLAIAEIRRLMAVGGIHAPDMQRERLVKERGEAEREVLARVPAADRDWFEVMMRYAQAAQWFSEDHDYLCELRAFPFVRQAAIEVGKRLVKRGVIEDPEDALMLLIDHLVAASCQEQSAPLIKPVLKRNKEEWLNNLKIPFPSDEIPMFQGDPSWIPAILQATPLLSVVVQPQLAKPEEVGATCVGAAGAPGVAEGIARVIMSDKEWDQLQPGEILVTMVTSATWTPLFGSIKAVVTDAGGMLCHPVIVGREYGIPAVVGCMDATQKIKSGDRIRVDGNTCRVYKL